MQYECPSCKIIWKDEKEPIDLYCHPLCSFCSVPHSQKELLNWQMEHLEEISIANSAKILIHLYRYIELEFTALKEKLNDLSP